MKKFVIAVCISLFLIGGVVDVLYADDTNKPVLQRANRVDSVVPAAGPTSDWRIPPVREDEPSDIPAVHIGRATFPKDQGQQGACNEYAVIANVESTLLTDHTSYAEAGSPDSFDKIGIAQISKRTFLENDDYDYAEQHAIACNWYARNGIKRKDYFSIANLLSQEGVVDQNIFDDFVTPGNTCNSEAIEQLNGYKKTLLDWRKIPVEMTNDPDLLLKYYIYTYGPIYSGLHACQEDVNDECVSGDVWYEEELSGYYPSFDESLSFPEELTNVETPEVLYYSDTENLIPNHAILIIGWDDTVTHEGGQGAWIFKNSWGEDWGYGGYGYIAYGSAGVGSANFEPSFLYDWQDYDDSGGLLYYDEAGSTAGVYYKLDVNTASGIAWGMVRFIPEEDGYATRVEFWTHTLNTVVDIYLYDDVEIEESGEIGFITERAQRLNNSFKEAGYHSVKLETPLPITAWNDIIVKIIFRLEDSSITLSEHPEFQGLLPEDELVLQKKGSGYIKSSDEGLSYESSDGNSWIDTVMQYDSFVAVRLRYTGILEDDTPDTSSYYVFDEHGGSWHDVEKSPENDDDDEMCWAAAAANILAWTGWDASFLSEHLIFDEFLKFWTNGGGLMEYGWRWWFNGTEPPDQHSWSQLNEDWAEAGAWDGYYPDYNFYDEEYFFEEWATYYSDWSEWKDGQNLLSSVVEHLDNGDGTTLAIYSETGGHALSVWGYEYYWDNDEKNYAGLWVTDSDDTLTGMKLLSLTYDLDDGLWFLDLENQYDYRGWFIGGVQGLEIYPTSPISEIPEPATLFLFGAGVIGILAVIRKRMHKKS